MAQWREAVVRREDRPVDRPEDFPRPPPEDLPLARVEVRRPLDLLDRARPPVLRAALLRAPLLLPLPLRPPLWLRLLLLREPPRWPREPERTSPATESRSTSFEKRLGLPFFEF